MASYLTIDNYTLFLNTGREVTAQNLLDDTTELYLGVGKTAYMDVHDAERLLSADEFQATVSSINPLFVYLPDDVLFHLLRREQYYITNDEN